MQTIEARQRIRAGSERGAGLVEYALLVALIAIVCLTAVAFLGTSGSSKLGGAGKKIDRADQEKPLGTCTDTTYNGAPYFNIDFPPTAESMGGGAMGPGTCESMGY